MKLRVTTESGSIYQFDGRKVTRILGDGSMEMRHDGEPLVATFWGTPKVGQRMEMILEGALFGGGSTLRKTTPVVSITYETE